MRKVVAAISISLDGVMQAPGAAQEDPTGGFAYGGWIVPYFDDMMGREENKIFSAPFDLLLGRRTYEIFAAYWPHIDDDFEFALIAQRFNAVTKYVATSSNEPLTWKNSVALRGDVVAEIHKLKQSEGPILLLQGSGNLIQTLLAHDLIDEFSVSIYPLLLGRGKRLFGEGTMPAALRLVDSKTSSTGVTMNNYVRDGAVRTGSFGPDKPSAAELARREQMKREG